MHQSRVKELRETAAFVYLFTLVPAGLLFFFVTVMNSVGAGFGGASFKTVADTEFYTLPMIGFLLFAVSAWSLRLSTCLVWCDLLAKVALQWWLRHNGIDRTNGIEPFFIAAVVLLSSAWVLQKWLKLPSVRVTVIGR